MVDEAVRPSRKLIDYEEHKQMEVRWGLSKENKDILKQKLIEETVNKSNGTKETIFKQKQIRHMEKSIGNREETDLEMKV